MKPYKNFSKDIKINDKTITVFVRIYCHQDDICLDDIIGDSENREELEEKIASGRMFIGLIEVKASFFNFNGSDILGGCYIETSDDIDSTVEDYRMINNAIDDLETNLRDNYITLKRIFEK